jgi:hypothetical protein
MLNDKKVFPGGTKIRQMHSRVFNQKAAEAASRKVLAAPLGIAGEQSYCYIGLVRPPSIYETEFTHGAFSAAGRCDGLLHF